LGAGEHFVPMAGTATAHRPFDSRCRPPMSDMKTLNSRRPRNTQPPHRMHPRPLRIASQRRPRNSRSKPLCRWIRTVNTLADRMSCTLQARHNNPRHSRTYACNTHSARVMHSTVLALRRCLNAAKAVGRDFDDPSAPLQRLSCRRLRSSPSPSRGHRPPGPSQSFVFARMFTFRFHTVAHACVERGC
jgi:hypothetical protein